MERQESRINLKVLAIRIALGLLFAFLLKQFFLPTTGIGTILITAGLLVFFAYVFESIHKSRKL